MAQTPGAGHPDFSPDGAYLAYTSDFSGRSEVYVVPYPREAGDRPWQVSIDGGIQPRWSGDSKKIYFLSNDRLYEADVIDGVGFETAEPVFLTDGIDAEWDISSDGSFAVTLDLRPTPRMKMIQNWFEELKQRVPTGGR